MGDHLQLREEALQWRAIEGEVVAIDMRESVYLGINRTGAILWPCLVSGTTRQALMEQLVESCGIDEARAEADVDEFLRLLAELDLLEA